MMDKSKYFYTFVKFTQLFEIQFSMESFFHDMVTNGKNGQNLDIWQLS